MKKYIIITIILLTSFSFANDLSNVEFSIENEDINRFVVEDIDYLKKINKEHTIKYYSYEPIDEVGDYTYYDVAGIERKMVIDKSVLPNNIVWNKKHNIYDKESPLNYDMYYGVDVSKHNGNINWKKVKDAGFDFAFVRIAYRGYGKSGTLLKDERGIINLKEAKANGLKIGAYVFSQSINEDEALEEAKFAVKLLNDSSIILDLPLVYDVETIKDHIARTDDISGEQFTKNAICFLEYVKKSGFTPAIYSNLVWESYYFDMSKFNDYDIWLADYSEFPQTPYHYKYWQFSEFGKVAGITDIGGFVDLNVRFERR